MLFDSYMMFVGGVLCCVIDCIIVIIVLNEWWNVD